MRQPEWVLPETVVALHEQLLAAFGGSAGVRDAGLQQSALARPEYLPLYGSPTVFDSAASYAFGLVSTTPSWMGTSARVSRWQSCSWS